MVEQRINPFIYTSELIVYSTICVHSATRHNIHMYPYFLFAAIRNLNRPRLSLSDLVAQSAEYFFFTSWGSRIPFTRAIAQWVFHGLHIAL